MLFQLYKTCHRKGDATRLLLINEELDNVTHQGSSRAIYPRRFALELTIAIFPTGGLLGSLIFAFLVDTFGRKRTMLLNDIFSIVCAFLLCWFRVIESFPLSFAARLAAGICTGILTTVVPMYLGEIAPVNLRGAIIEMCLFFMTMGVALAQAVSLPEFLGIEEGSPILVGLTGIGPLFQLFLLLFLPESPRYLLIQKKQEREAKQVLKKLRGSHYTEDEIEELYQEDYCEQEEKGMRVHKLLCSRGLRWPLLCSIIVIVGQQFSGVNVVYFYTDSIFKSTGIGDENVVYLSLGATCLTMLAHLIGIYGVDAWGRRILLLCGFGICSISCILLTMTLELETTISWMPYMSTIFVMIFIFGHFIGPSPVPIVLTTELFLQSSRSSAYAIVGSVHWFCNGFIALVFLHLQRHLGPYSFLIFFPFSSVTFFYILKALPETKRKTFLSVRKLIEMHLVKSLENEQEANKEAMQECTPQSDGRRETAPREGRRESDRKKHSLPRDRRRESGLRDGRRESGLRDRRTESGPRDGRRESGLRDGRKESEPRDGRRESEPHDGRRESEPHDGRRESEPRDGRRESEPRDGRRESGPRDGRRESEPHDGRRESGPHDGRRESGPRDGRRESFLRDGRRESGLRDGRRESFLRDGRRESGPHDGRRESLPHERM
ncbi:solute carrier family 2, facilitated glucose transporter member 5-like isoform X2 [Hemicordylus capensis]|uniref:solute carrier family 2, facilitated glucose transporter member 5-like isoform X2 n=1 Tax=Hemicordylus capensis TaxID=884348 RepID=UPI00230334F9|nr:solute carrier family 2, facilitated glucose transporter member 5-like isoform X2 [Hemicordylus capensis]